MTVLREEDVAGFLKRRLAHSNGILVHGADAAAVSVLARSVGAALGGDIQTVDTSLAKSAPGGFMDQMLSLSLLGDRQILFVEGADDSTLKFLDAAFAEQRICNFVLVTAEALGKTSKLRVAAESAVLFASLAVYEEEQSVARVRVRKILEADNLLWAPTAEDEFFDTVGHERAVVTREVQKLALYARGQTQISAADVTAVCGDVASFEVDELIDAILGGDLESTDRIFIRLGADQQKFFPLFALHLNKLQGFRSEMENGATADSVARNAKPPIFFKRKNAILAQIRCLSLEDVINVQETLQAAILQSRKMADLSSPITSRALLAIARLCRSKIAA